MREDLLQFIWKEGLFNGNALQTTSGESMFIEERGQLNTIAGPDFSSAKIRIGDTLWAGSVEIHIKASEWFAHGHEKDQAYDNVVLHVVYENDLEAKNSRGDIIPVLELKGRLASSTIARYEYLKSSKNKIACADHFQDYPQLKFRMWLQRMLVSRLERKSNDIALLHKHSKGDWVQTLYALLAGYLGQNTNKQPFQELARRLPFNTLTKHADNSLQLEAMLYGVANLLPKEQSGDYAGALQQEFDFLKKKHTLQPITQQWKFGGIRPDAFPTRRMALLAAMIPQLDSMNELILNGSSRELTWPEIEGHTFWDEHYTFEKKSSKSTTIILSDGLKQLLTINVIAPYLFYYGKSTGSQAFVDRAISMLEKIQSEENQIIRSWRKLHFKSSNAADSQALIELTTQYCLHKNCVLCNVGKSIISKP